MFIKATVALALLSAVQAVPLVKRIQQTIDQSTADWEKACLAAGGGLKCNPQSVASFTTLLAAAGPCDQQNQGDNMIDLAHSLNNDANMIRLTQIFVQQPRNSPTSLSVPYCQSAPRNSELNGLFQCQFQGTNPTTFVGNIPVGQPGTIPFGKSSTLSPPQSCPANPSGGVPNGSQLVDLVGGGGSGASSSAPPAQAAAPAPPAAPAATQPAPAAPAINNAGSAPPATSSTPPPSTGGSTSSFALSNGQKAQSLNAQFASLTPSSSCDPSTTPNACIDGKFAQCVGSSFVLTPCAGGLTCAVLPLVNSPGTSTTCTTMDDALARIARTGAPGGFTGSG